MRALETADGRVPQEDEPLTAQAADATTGSRFAAQKRRMKVVLVAALALGLFVLILAAFRSGGGPNLVGNDRDESDLVGNDRDELDLVSDRGEKTDLASEHDDEIIPTTEAKEMDLSMDPEELMEADGGDDEEEGDGEETGDSGDDIGSDTDTEGSQKVVIDKIPPFLANIECIPKVCSVRKHFLHSGSSLADPKGFTLLASFPGSGNTWTRAIIEESSRIFSGSVYKTDYSLLAEGFVGESHLPYTRSFPTTSVVKTHWPLNFFILPDPKTRYAIQVIRSPFDALLAEFHRQHGRGASQHVRVATKGTLRTMFAAWFKTWTDRWLGHVHVWNGPFYWNNSDTHETEGITSYIHERKIFQRGNPNNNRGVPTLVLFYEDFVHNFVATSLRMLTFLREKSLGRAMPDISSAMICALRSYKRANSVKRKKSSLIYNPYNDPQGGIYKKELVKSFCDKAKDFWFEEMWGNCYEAKLQAERKYAMPYYTIPEVPEKLCTE